ncbi:hypothetical protein R69608_07021 [Paraburkholderia nemoris]|uniref:hypothetical protein n=1 Tax=Paraburkholderia nemoris TaxID=2793076 RepID=UPI0019147F10|nr:hypothetical protein [Paraburkholderia nemoris]MBK5152470.1 hypothetical protein [Burkholderia sp. R-69608]CAE6967574.1 hypothetical protein R69608_07021 [Paraburkholderia nemoris]
MRQTTREFRSFTWRVRAYEGELLEHGAALLLVAEISDKITKEASSPFQGDKAQRCLHEVVVSLNNRRMASYPLQPFAPVGDFMTICVDELGSNDVAVGRPIARLDMMRDTYRAHGSLLTENYPRIDLEPAKIEPTDGVLDVFLRLLSFMLH